MENSKTELAENSKLWEEAIFWVKKNQSLIRQIAGPYMRHMAADRNDILQEAVLAAYQTVLMTRKKGETDRFDPYFRVIFRTNCIKLASGIRTVSVEEISFLPVSKDNDWQEKDVNRPTVIRALDKMSRRERQAWGWLLRQPKPAGSPDLAKKFKISNRHACRLISNGIKRLHGEKTV